MINDFNAYLSSLISNETTIDQAMNYSLLQKGKRLRPMLLLAKLKDYKIEAEVGFPAAASLEMIHTYSLIHDDLPAMDDDDYRRGELTNHKKFSEAIAILAGDGLLTKAFEIITESNYQDQIKVALINLLAKFAGHQGMIYGQELDIAERKLFDIDELSMIHRHKTGKLFATSLMMAAIIGKKTQDLTILEELGLNLGLAFQIHDDILDVVGDFKTIGKLPSDLKANKVNYVSLLGLKEAEIVMAETYQKCYNILSQFNESKHLLEVIDTIKTRIY